MSLSSQRVHLAAFFSVQEARCTFFELCQKREKEKVVSWNNLLLSPLGPHLGTLLFTYRVKDLGHQHSSVSMLARSHIPLG